MKVPTFLSIPREETAHLPVEQALAYAAQKVVNEGHEGADVICANTRKTYAGDPETIKKSIVNLRVFKGMRPENERIHSAVPGVPQVFILKH